MIPLFDMNVHDNSKHRKKEANDLERFGIPQPKKFPVNLKLQPNLHCQDNKVLLILAVQTKPDATGQSPYW